MKTDDNVRVREMNTYHQGTGGGTGRDHLQEPPADNAEPGLIDPAILTGRDPTFDHFSVVAVPAGSVFSSNQDQSGVGYSRVAPPPRQQGTSSSATITSGMYEAHLAATAASSTSAALAGPSTSVPQAAGFGEILLDVSNESWASVILNQSQEMPEPSPLRSGVICRTIVLAPLLVPEQCRTYSLPQSGSATAAPIRAAVPAPILPATPAPPAATPIPPAAVPIHPAAEGAIPPAVLVLPASGPVPPAAVAVLPAAAPIPPAAALVPPADTAAIPPAAGEDAP